MFSFFGYIWGDSNPNIDEYVKKHFQSVNEHLKATSAYTYELAKMNDPKAKIKENMLSSTIILLQEEIRKYETKEFPYQMTKDQEFPDTKVTDHYHLFNLFYRMKMIMDVHAEYYLPTLKKDRGINSGVSQLAVAAATTGGIIVAGNFVILPVGAYVATYLVKTQLAGLATTSLLNQATVTAVLTNVAATLQFAERQIFLAKSIANMLSVPAGVAEFIYNFELFCPKSAQLFLQLQSSIQAALTYLQPIIAEEIKNEAEKHFQKMQAQLVHEADTNYQTPRI